MMNEILKSRSSSLDNYKEFTFSDSSKKDEHQVTIKILELPGADYGTYIWPCAPILAQYVWQNKDLVRTQSILEIGAGTGLPGIVAAKCGANVILSDSNTKPLSLDLCRKSAELNGLKNVTVCGITWGEVTPTLTQLPPIDLILASDCFYHSKDFEDVIMTMSFILHRCPNAKVWCAYQERSSERSIEYLLDKWSLYGHELPLPSMEHWTSSYDSHLKHIIRIYEIRIKMQNKVY